MHEMRKRKWQQCNKEAVGVTSGSSMDTDQKIKELQRSKRLAVVQNTFPFLPSAEPALQTGPVLMQSLTVKKHLLCPFRVICNC